MSFDTAFLDLMPHTISVYPFTSVDEYGEPTHSTSPTVYRCLVQETPTLIGSPYGEETVASHVAYVASTGRIDLTSLVTLPDGSQPTLIRSDVYSDEDGTAHHVVLYFGVSK